MNRLLPGCFCAVALVACAAAQSPAGWSSWRGPLGTGVAPDADPPVTWSETENIKWKVELPGLGHSTPLVLGDRIYLTTAIAGAPAGEPEDGETAAAKSPPPTRQRRSGGGRSNWHQPAPTAMHEFVVMALRRDDGKTVWRTVVNECVPHEAFHSTGSFASNSPVTDGEHIFAFFGSRGLHCLDLAGEVRWSVDLGQMRKRGSFGEGSSPALAGDTLVVVLDHEGASFLAAFDRFTGKEKWRQPRQEDSSWSSPVIVPVGDAAQVVVNAPNATRGYDLATGELRWSLGGMTDDCISSPLFDDGHVYVMSGHRRSVLQAVRLADATGDLEGSEHVLWTHRRSTANIPTGLLWDGLLYFPRENSGVLSCLTAATGEVQYEGERLRGIRTMYASLVGAADRLYATSLDGVTAVVRRGAAFELLATNRLDESFAASPALAGTEIYLRGRKFLYCIAEAR